MWMDQPHLLDILDLHAVFVDKGDPLLSQQVSCVLVHDALNLGVSLNHQSLSLLQPLVTCVQHLLILLCRQGQPSGAESHGWLGTSAGSVTKD